MAGTRRILNTAYVEDQDSSSDYISPVVSLEYSLKGLYYQFVWENGVRGSFQFEATIFDDQWEPLEDCSPIIVNADGVTKGSQIVSIPQAWLLVPYLRFKWTSGEMSKGNFSVAQGITPT